MLTADLVSRRVFLKGLAGLLALCPWAAIVSGADYRTARKAMVARQIRARGVAHEPTLRALATVPRHRFVPLSVAPFAYQDSALPIGYGQTISQPYVVGYMTEQLQPGPDCKVLEIGTGSGYQAAVLAKIVARVYSMEIIPELARAAKKRLADLEFANVTVLEGDGFYGWEQEAPYDAIIVTAAAEFIPPRLINQLKDGGRMIIPVGSPFGMQWLILLHKENGTVRTKRLFPVRFVPLTRK